MVLDEYARKGKKLLHPIIAAGHPIELGNWPLDRVPEFFWLALMVDRFGRRECRDHVIHMTKAIHGTVNKNRNEFKVIRPYLLSEHARFSELERSAIVISHRRSKWFQAVSPFVADLVVIWPEFPAAYLARAKSKKSKRRLANEIKDVLGRFSHRHDELADVVQAIIAIAEIRSGHVSIAAGLEWPNFEAIVEDPTTDEAKQIAGFAVATCSQLNRFGREESDLSWNRIFWNRCYRLQQCEYEYD